MKLQHIIAMKNESMLKLMFFYAAIAVLVCCGCPGPNEHDNPEPPAQDFAPASLDEGVTFYLATRVTDDCVNYTIKSSEKALENYSGGWWNYTYTKTSKNKAKLVIMDWVMGDRDPDPSWTDIGLLLEIKNTFYLTFTSKGKGKYVESCYTWEYGVGPETSEYEGDFILL